MNIFESQTYYEILDIPVNATPFETREAYKTALSIYNADALATYSFFSEKEREIALNRIDEAFRILIDEKKRADYDRRLISEGKVTAASIEKNEKKRTIPLFQTKSVVEESALSIRIRDRIRSKDVRTNVDSILSKDLIKGSDLKSLRESIGIGIEEIYGVTRITASTLTAIENDDSEKLPSAIYLKNFIKSYAELLQIDAEKTTKGYMKNLSRKSNG